MEEFPGKNNSPENKNEELDSETTEQTNPKLEDEETEEAVKNAAESESTPEKEPDQIEKAPGSYLELKREYKEKKRVYEEALEKQPFLKRAFRLGRKNLSPEVQALYDESLQAEKAYYQSFVETQKAKVEARLNRDNESGETLSTIPLLVQRHITKPERDRLEAQKVHLSPRLQSILKHKYAVAAGAVAGVGLKSLSLMSSFGVGLAAGAGTRWGLNKFINAREQRLEQKTKTFNDLFESGELDDLADIKNEYFQELRKIDNRKLAANLTAAGVAVAAGSSAHDYFDSVIPEEAEGALREKTGEYVDTAGDKAGGVLEAAKEKFDSWFGQDDSPEPIADDATESPQAAGVEPTPESESTPSQTDVPAEEAAQTGESVDREAENLKERIEQIREDAFEGRTETLSDVETLSNVKEAEHIAFEVLGLTPEEIGEKLNFRMEGGVITEVEGRPVPESYFSEADKANMETARQIGSVESGDSSPEEMEEALDAADEAFDAQFSTPETNPPEAVTPAEQPPQYSPLEGEQSNRPELVATGEEETLPHSPVEAKDPLAGATEPEAGAENVEREPMGPPTPEPMITQDSPEFVGPPTPETIETKFAALLQEVSEAKYEVQSGDNVWDIIENKLASNGLFQDLEPGQKLHLIDELKDRVVAMSPAELKEFGISSGDPNVINVGEQLDLAKLFDQDTLREAMGHAENLSASEIASIEANSPDISDAAATEPGAAAGATDEAASPAGEGVAAASEAGPTEAPAAEVPDYSGESEQPPGEATAEGLREQAGEGGEVQPETLSNIPREVTTEEVLAKQQEIQNNLQAGVKAAGGLPDASQLVGIDAAIGYEPLYTPDLLERTIEIASPPGDMNINHLYGLISEQMFHAYQGGEIDLPVQWTYLMDMLADGPMDADSTVLEEVLDGDEDKLNVLASQVKTDIKLPELSSAQIQELGISSGSFEELRQGDEVNVGEIIKLMMQNMAERINAAPPSDTGFTPTSSVTST